MPYKDWNKSNKKLKRKTAYLLFFREELLLLEDLFPALLLVAMIIIISRATYIRLQIFVFGKQKSGF